MSDFASQSMQDKWNTSELGGANSAYVDSLYEDYLADPSTVEPSWRTYFDSLNEGSTKDSSHEAVIEAFKMMANLPKGGSDAGADAAKHVAAMQLLYAYRHVGHRQSKIDPLNHLDLGTTPELTPEHHGLTASDLDTEFDSVALPLAKSHKLKDIIAELERIYCSSIGAEYMHVSCSDERTWLRERLEGRFMADPFPPEKQQWLLKSLASADGLEKYLGMRYVGQKRFSLEGGDALIPLLHEMIYRSGEGGIEELVIAMAHRGRLNVLVNIMGKSPEDLFEEFEGKHAENLLSGDVKYHNGFSSDVETKGGDVHLALAFNPSHLEIASPVAKGSVRARQARRNFDPNKVLAIHMHGDAAFAGQGVVMETLAMSQTEGYHTGGDIHVVINNQIGFTTSKPNEARSSHYCSDIAKMIEAPIFHVNGNDAEAVIRVAQLAQDYRMAFNKDVVIDLVCYRLHGHNEADEPSATQPMMYQIIKKLKAPWQVYGEQLVQQGVMTSDGVKQVFTDFRALLEAGKSYVKTVKPHSNFLMDWSKYKDSTWDMPFDTGMDKQRLKAIAAKLDIFPEGFTPQRQVGKTLADRALMTAEKMPMNWGYAEVLAYATLVEDGHEVRLAGEDCERGTFSHRHSVIHDHTNGNTYTPLKHVTNRQEDFRVINSLLSEEAVLAFEYGFACSSPNTLTLWEAQFGDFANTAQTVVDQFISSGEEKWGRLCGLVMLLPHGFEGMGAEHSSARLERYLQMCAHGNMQVCVPSTPAQMYHMLRRQMIRPLRKPLIVMTPKSLLRHPLVTSTMDELADGHFHNVIDEIDKIGKAKRVVFCSGKVYYDLLIKRREAKINDIAIVRIEQLYPFPKQDVEAIFKKYSHVTDFMWCQEEPKNQGAWRPCVNYYLSKYMTGNRTLTYAGRAAFAAPAVGYPALHHQQQDALVADALHLKPKKD
jgi:2-oxoglutarate dehydrogenase E1 component